MLQLYRAKEKKILNDSFDIDMDGWGGDINLLQWHRVTLDTNADQSSGLIGNIAMNCAGCYQNGIMQKEITLDAYGEMAFDYYIQNSNPQSVQNSLKVYVDDIVRFDKIGPIPWTHTEPIGLSVGKHIIKFEYQTTEPQGQKCIVDNIQIWAGKKIDCIMLSDYSPAKPMPKLAPSKTLRGFTRYQEMTVADTEIQIPIFLSGGEYFDFIKNYGKPHYFIDEFGICYRGIFPESPSTKSITLSTTYQIELTLQSPQEVGVSFA